VWQVLRRAMWVAAVITIATAVFAGEAGAQDNPARPTRKIGARMVIKRGAEEPILDGHGWLTLQTGPADGASAGRRLVLLHLPAREIGGLGTGGAEDLSGVVRVGGELAGRAAEPEGIAWWRHHVYVACQPEPSANGEGVRKVFKLSAVRNYGSAYEYYPPGGLEELPVLPAAPGFLGLAAMPSGPAALLAVRGESANQGRAELRVLSGAEWTRVDLPWEGEHPRTQSVPSWTISGGTDSSRAAAKSVVRLLSWRNAIAIATFDRNGTDLAVWVGTWGGGNGSAGRMDWSQRTFRLDAVGGSDRAAVQLLFVEAQRKAADALLATMIDSAGGASVYALRPSSEPQLLASIPGVPASAVTLPMAAPGDIGDPSGQVVFAWWEGTPSALAGEETNGLRLREVSAVTGRLMYSGEARLGKHAGQPMIQWIVVLGLLAGVGVLVFARASDPRVVPELPQGRHVADPIRRLIAAFLDYVPSAIVVALMQGRSPDVLLMPSTILGGAEPTLGDLNLVPLGLTIGLTILHASIGEWLTGKSFGKFIMGIRVVSTAGPMTEGDTPLGRFAGPGVDGEPVGIGVMAHPTLRQVLIRNLVRWLVPMLAVFAMLDIAGRHPGDLAARTLVVADPNDGK
jgi:hypothetical protein